MDGSHISRMDRQTGHGQDRVRIGHCGSGLVIVGQDWSLQVRIGHCRSGLVIVGQDWSFQVRIVHCGSGLVIGNADKGARREVWVRAKVKSYNMVRKYT